MRDNDGSFTTMRGRVNSIRVRAGSYGIRSHDRRVWLFTDFSTAQKRYVYGDKKTGVYCMLY